MRELGDLLAAAGAHREGGRIWSEATRSFSLENGAEAISTCFSEVALHRYEDALEVTEAEPLVAYAASLLAHRPEILSRLRTLAEERLAREGALRIGKEAGLFAARRAPLSEGAGGQ